MKRRTILNISCSLFYQLVSVICGMIIPKLFIGSFGSEVNGLIASLSSFLSFFSLLEGGMGFVISSKLYKPFANSDYDEINLVLNAGKTFYRRLAWGYLLFAIAVGIIYPIIKPTDFSFAYIFFLTILLAAPGFVSNYSFIILSTITHIDCRTYVTHILYTLSSVLNLVLLLIASSTFQNVHFFKLLSFLACFVCPILLNIYVKKHYKVNLKLKSSSKILKERWDSFIHNLSRFITNNVDVYILTFFSTLKNVSIYSVYSAIIVSIKAATNSISDTLTPLLGKSLAIKDDSQNVFLNQLFITGFFVVIVFSNTYLLIDPFMSIYTANITDANYINPIFSFIFVTSELVACLSQPYIEIAYVKGEFKKTKYLVYTETIINLILSFGLVFKFGLIGVVFATLFSRIVRFVMQAIYLSKSELTIKMKPCIIKTIEKTAMIIVIVIVNKSFIAFDSIYSLSDWVLMGCQSTVVSILLFSIMSYIFDRKLTKAVFKFVVVHK